MLPCQRGCQRQRAFACRNPTWKCQVCTCMQVSIRRAFGSRAPGMPRPWVVRISLVVAAAPLLLLAGCLEALTPGYICVDAGEFPDVRQHLLEFPVTNASTCESACDAHPQSLGEYQWYEDHGVCEGCGARCKDGDCQKKQGRLRLRQH